MIFLGLCMLAFILIVGYGHYRLNVEQRNKQTLLQERRRIIEEKAKRLSIGGN